MTYFRFYQIPVGRSCLLISCLINSYTIQFLYLCNSLKYMLREFSANFVMPTILKRTTLSKNVWKPNIINQVTSANKNVHRNFIEYKVNNRTQELIQSDTIRSTSSLQHQRERQTNTRKQPQSKQTASRVGNSFPKKWELCYPNLSEYIINLRNCSKRNIGSNN